MECGEWWERNKIGKVSRTKLAMAACFHFTHSKVNSSKLFYAEEGAHVLILVFKVIDLFSKNRKSSETPNALIQGRLHGVLE